MTHEPEQTIEYPTDALEGLRVLVDARDRQIQKVRIAFGNRAAAIERAADTANPATAAMVQRWHERFQALEEDMDEEIGRYARAVVDEIPILAHMVAVKGVGPILSAKVVSMIDIERAPTVSALWRYAGMAVIDGEREKPVKGEKLHYNLRLKTACHLVATSFLRANSPYRRVYNAAKEQYVAQHPEWTPGHVDFAARRKMAKMWLSHLWLRWRQLEGLPVTAPYVHDKLAHEHYYTPEEFGWPSLAVAVPEP